MKWSLNTYQTCQEWELKRILETAENTGYHGVELLMDFRQKHGFEWDTPKDQWEGLKSDVDASNVVISSLTSCQNFHSEDASDRQETVHRVTRVIDMAEYMDCNHVRVLGDRYNDENRDAVVGYVTDGLKALGDYAGEKDITVSMEMHGSFTDPDSAMEVIEAVNLPNVGFVFNSQFRGCEGGSIEPLFSRIAPHITAVHTHKVETPETFELYRQMFQWLNRIGFTGYISNECAYTGPDPEKVLALYVGLFKAFV
ncbi:sugar phosphate isomerase/epimerase [Candidatus Poribacteria bacterium]|nr:sugar phosphate isomerase/epimerase [Candidatus Poribacteria bacterium]MYB66848.1 sugar phosphate isomerase/epimerase [Candidatus Poribacteria bacterium]MYF54462.1 sugar phosphate isomerase/epimerase [Candidatus Poribacteria bacterium]MYI94705.1 sugar phosphate isomerase/epimerase [Candidatus Poribacteria bacterium]